MPEIFYEAFGLHNLPVTVLLGLILIYWIMVMIGVADGDMDGVDPGGAHTPDLHMDGGHAGDFADGAGGADSHGGLAVGGHLEGHGGSQNSGFWHTCGRMLHLGEVPLMIVLSVLSLLMWFFSVTANVLFNGEPGNRSAGMALLLLIPNLIVSGLLTRIILSPLRGLIRRMQTTESEVEHVVGRTGTVITSEVSDKFGQVGIPATGAPLVVNARVTAGKPAIPRGTEVLIFEASPESVFYYVRPLRDPGPGRQDGSPS